MKQLISVIIPALNEEQYLPLLLKDFENQTEKNFEVIVVDAQSEDQTKNKTLSFTNTLQLKYIESPERNLSYQRNLGAKHAHGDYLFFLDADARIDNNTIQKIEEYILRDKRLIYLLFPKPSKKNIINLLHFFILTNAVVAFDKIGKAFALGPAIVIEKKFFKTIEGYDEKAYVSEDQNLVIKARRKGVRARFMPDVNYVFSMRRFENENWFILMGKYSLFTLITLIRGVVYTDAIKYEMGGKNIKHNNMKYLISVVIPAYNEEKLIGKCVEAVTNQTISRDKYEVLVVDNNSTDDTARIALAHGATVIPFTEKQGFTPSKNYGVHKSSSEIIAFTDADSIVDKKWLESILIIMKKEKLMCIGGTILPTGKSIMQKFMFRLYDFFARINQLFGTSLIWGPNMAIRKNAFLEVGGFNSQINAGDDWDLVMRLQNKFGVKSTLYTNKIVTKTSPRKQEKLSLLIPYIFIGIINYFTIFIFRRSIALGNHPDVR